MKKIEWKQGLSDDELIKYPLSSIVVIERNKSQYMRDIVKKARTGSKLSNEIKNKISKGNLGKKHTSDFCKKITVRQLGKKRAKETIEKMRIASTGRKHTLEARKKMSQANKGKKLSLETRKKMSEAKKGVRYSAKLSFDIAEQIRKDYSNGISQSYLAKKYGVTQANISAIVKNKTWKKK